MTLTKPQAFFTALRDGLLGPTLSPGEVSGCNAILAACDGLPLAWTAYAFATAWHETAFTLQPIKERGGEGYFTRRYDIKGDNPPLAKRLGNLKPGDGAKYAGRGYVQLTGRANYLKAERELGSHFVEFPDLALERDNAARIMRWGMTEGAFTGKALNHYLPTSTPANLAQFKEARRIINGTDRALHIAGQAMQFQAALQAGGWKP